MRRDNGQVLQLLSFHRFTDLGTTHRTDSEDIFSNCCEPVGLRGIEAQTSRLVNHLTTVNIQWLLNCILHKWIEMEYTSWTESLWVYNYNRSNIQEMSWFHQFCSRHRTKNIHIKPSLQLHWLGIAGRTLHAVLLFLSDLGIRDTKPSPKIMFPRFFKAYVLLGRHSHCLDMCLFSYN